MNLSTILDKFTEHGILPTSQRLEIAAILFAGEQHLTADQIVRRLRSQGSRAAKATVYNTLNLFVEKGLIRECYVDPKHVYFDPTTEPHHHFFDQRLFV